MDEAEYAPRQYAKDGGITEVDFRSLAKSHDKSAIPNRDPSHASGGKRKRDEEVRRGARRMRAAAGGCGLSARPASRASSRAHARREQADGVEDMDAEAGAGGVEGGVEVPSSKRRAYDNVSGKVSHRPWKAAYTRASAIAGRAPSDWDAKMREKAQKKAIQACSAAPLRWRCETHTHCARRDTLLSCAKRRGIRRLQSGCAGRRRRSARSRIAKSPPLCRRCGALRVRMLRMHSHIHHHARA